MASICASFVKLILNFEYLFGGVGDLLGLCVCLLKVPVRCVIVLLAFEEGSTLSQYEEQSGPCQPELTSFPLSLVPQHSFLI